jgi:tetratricopeptide (TPR) repeat protein
MGRAPRIAICTALVVLVSLVSPALLFAGDDGGGRSVFAIGAGNRALGLGGAFAGIANDASAPLWNPGGLGLVQRTEIQGSQTSYYGLGIDEQYASFVIPSWRWGVASATFRHFGVGDIERRDDRNVLLEEELSNHETEFSLGYGRKLGDSWSVGGVVKLRHQSLAGFSDSGTGVDLGVVVQPLSALGFRGRHERRLSLGVSVRNVVEPKVRLSNENVPDPTALRVGTAYYFQVLGNRTVLAAVDVEQTRGMDTRLHVGMEMWFHPMLTLRVGANDGMFTAGSGIGWRGVTLNYAYETNPLGNVHRMGLAFSFGPTVEQRRCAAIEARENELQARLAEAFEKRQNERISGLLAEADVLMQEGDFDEALGKLAVVATLQPGQAGALSRQSRCLTEIGARLESEGGYAAAAVSYAQALSISPDDAEALSGYQRCRAESDRQAERTQEIRRHFDTALDAFGQGRLLEAKRGFQAVLRTAPEDTEAATMLKRTQDAIDYRAAELLEEAERLIVWGQLGEARAHIDDVRTLRPDARGLAAAEASLKRAKAAADQPPPPPGAETGTTAQPGASDGSERVSDEQWRELEHLYESGVEAMSQRRSEDAIRYFELVWSVSPGYQRVSDHLTREYLMRGMEFFADGKLDKAVEYWENARRVDPTDERVIGYLSRAREQVARTQQILGNDQ